jgi:hypothetical protein
MFLLEIRVQKFVRHCTCTFLKPHGIAFATWYLNHFILNHMKLKFLIIAPVLIFQAAVAQNGPAPLTLAQGTATTPVSPVATPLTVTDPSLPASSSSAETSIMDYISVYETATIEEEVKLAAERFNLSPSQQDVWLSAGTERREAEKRARVLLDSKATSYEKEPTYRGLRTAQNTFYETIIGYLAPTQKQALERDRLIHLEKQRRLAKLPPPPPPTVTVAPVDSAAIKQAELDKKAKEKKSKKKKKS